MSASMHPTWLLSAAFHNAVHPSGSSAFGSTPSSRQRHFLPPRCLLLPPVPAHYSASSSSSNCCKYRRCRPVQDPVRNPTRCRREDQQRKRLDSQTNKVRQQKIDKTNRKCSDVFLVYGNHDRLRSGQSQWSEHANQTLNCNSG